jgi:hypothetical protein
MFLDVVGNDVIVVLARAGDARSEFGQAYVGISPDSSFGDQSIIPVVTPDELIVLERVRRGYGKEVSDTGIIIDGERAVVPIQHFKRATASREVVFPRLARKQNPDSAVRIHPDHRDVPVGFRFEVDPGFLAPAVGVLIPVGPETDALPLGGSNPRRDTTELNGAGVGRRPRTG